MIITNKTLPRRTFLRGVGATMALPVLDSMFSPLTAVAQTMKKAPVRLGYVYTPNGIIGCNDKSPKKFLWTPTDSRRQLRVQPDDQVARAVPRERRRLSADWRR